MTLNTHQMLRLLFATTNVGLIGHPSRVKEHLVLFLSLAMHKNLLNVQNDPNTKNN